MAVYTRTDPEQKWTKVVLDIADLPELVSEYLTRKKLDLETGTVVVWVKSDRLTYTQVSSLKEHFLDDFGVTYRYMLPRYEVRDGRRKRTATGESTSGSTTPRSNQWTRCSSRPGAGSTARRTRRSRRGAWCIFEMLIPVKFYIDEQTGAKRLERLRDEKEIRAAQED